MVTRRDCSAITKQTRSRWSPASVSNLGGEQIAGREALPVRLQERVGGELLLSPQSVEIIKFGDPGRGR